MMLKKYILLEWFFSEVDGGNCCGEVVIGIEIFVMLEEFLKVVLKKVNCLL